MADLLERIVAASAVAAVAVVVRQVVRGVLRRG